jgi:hypothetical protein
MTGRRARWAVAAPTVAAALLAACSGPVDQPAPTAGTGAVTPMVTQSPAAGSFVAAEAPSPSVGTTPATTSGIAVPWCRTADLAVRYLGGDSTTVDPALDVIERYRLTNRSKVGCRAGAWVGVTMRGVAGCPTATSTMTSSMTSTATSTVTSTAVVTATTAATTTGAEVCPAGPPSARGRSIRSTDWPARDQVLSPGGSTVLSLLFSDTYAPQSCAEVWAPPARLELRPAGDPIPLVVDAKVYPCQGRLVVAPLGFGL